jgi:hypothetical protein
VDFLLSVLIGYTKKTSLVSAVVAKSNSSGAEFAKKKQKIIATYKGVFETTSSLIVTIADETRN